MFSIVNAIGDLGVFRTHSQRYWGRQPATPAATVEGTTLRTVYVSTTRKRSADDLAKLSVTVIDLTEVEDPTTLNHNKFASA
ncbi:hypothetical protein [Roseibium alexandrii]|uniref:hypothetical protein n=1 Tax=Roseibium alexandrii TaxID=388408 RepID=UPI0039929D79